MSISRRRSSLIALLVSAAAAVLAGCESPPPPFVPKSAVPPAVTYCCDYTGHKAGSQPWIMGGTCCCTPSDELMRQLHRDGFCVGQTADDLRARYAQAGIHLRGPKHEHCGGLCAAGPHVVLGGKCMCPPTPGTETYEQVIFAPPPRPSTASAGTTDKNKP